MNQQLTASRSTPRAQRKARGVDRDSDGKCARSTPRAQRNARPVPWLAAGLAVASAACLGATPANDAATPATQSAFAQRLAEARRAYFADLEGNHGAADRARQQFDAMEAQWPHQPVVDAYLGSLDLLESARTFAVWRKHTLAQEGLDKLDTAVNRDPSNLEARFVRALTTWHLPFFFHRKEQAEQDLSYIGPRAEQAARQGRLPTELASAALDYWGQVLSEHADDHTSPAPPSPRQASEPTARQAFEAAIRVAPTSPAAQDARKRLGH